MKAITAWLKSLPSAEVQESCTIDFLERCVSQSVKYSKIGDIIFEKLQVFAAGDESAEETAKIIDNRVQLLLDED